LTLSIDPSSARDHALRTIGRASLKALKAKVKPEAILILGSATEIPSQRYWDPAAGRYDGPVQTDDPYMYSTETPDATWHTAASPEAHTVKESDYAYPVGRLPATKVEELNALLAEAVAARDKTPLVYVSPAVAASSNAIKMFLEDLVNVRANALDVPFQSDRTKEKIVFSQTDTLNVDAGLKFTRGALLSLNANNGAYIAATVLGKGARGYVAVARFTHRALVDEFLDAFYNKLESSARGVTLGARYLSARASLAAKYAGKEEFAHVQAIRYYGDPLLKVKSD
jgi:hypothetical protein